MNKYNTDNCKIVMATANARYIHSALALKYLMANLGQYQSDTSIIEAAINDRPLDIAEKILAENPDIVVLSVYIWNASVLYEVAVLIKLISPQITIITGGPEVSFPEDPHPISNIADHTICGEGEKTLPKTIEALCQNKKLPMFIPAEPPVLTELNLPYHLYSDNDIAHRLIYVETSRGCAFKCEFCLSSLDKKVRHFNIDQVIEAFEQLWIRGARSFKFIDRTIHQSSAEKILAFFYDKSKQGESLFLHFEIVPDTVTTKLIKLLAKFPRGAIQLEAGVQTFNPEVAANISRKQNMDTTQKNIIRLLKETGVHVHSDLVAGLPGETIESFAAGFDLLLSTGVHEIQVGILKRLRGAPINRHTSDFKMVYSRTPSYDILKNRDISFKDMQRIKRFSRYFDLVFNNGNFKKTVSILWKGTTPFKGFMQFSDWLFNASKRTSGIALLRLAEFLFIYITTVLNMDQQSTARMILDDLADSGQPRCPKMLQKFDTDKTFKKQKKAVTSQIPKRQQKHIKEIKDQ